jgi:hypothetical protein
LAAVQASLAEKNQAKLLLAESGDYDDDDWYVITYRSIMNSN